MKFAALAALFSALAAIASPVAVPNLKRQATNVSDLQVLQYALTLEHLEAAYYKQALEKFNAKAFADAGYPDWVRGRFAQISQHETSHVKILSAALGNNTTPACNYAFPLTDVKTFVTFSSFLENIGVSAYIGANQFITEPLYASVAGSILAVEARHQGFVSGPVLTQADWTGPYDTPLGLDMVYTLASAFITSCPSTNAALPVKAAKALTVGTDAAPGSTVQYTFDNSGQGSTTEYAIYYSGLGSKAVQLDANHMAMIPSTLQGISYVLISTSSTAAGVTTANTVAGPAILSFPFNSATANPAFTGM